MNESLFEQIQKLVRQHQPTDAAWTSSRLEKALRTDAEWLPRLNEHNHKFIVDLGKILEHRGLRDPEVARLYLITIQSRSLPVLEWLRRSSRRRGAAAYKEFADLLRESEWRDDLSFIGVFDWIMGFHLSGARESPLIEYLLSWPDSLFLKFLSGQLTLGGKRAWHDYLWMIVFIEGQQSHRLASLLSQIPESQRSCLDAGAYTYLMAKAPLVFEPLVSAAGVAYSEDEHLRDAFDTYQRLRQNNRGAYVKEMREVCLKILKSPDGDTQLADAANQLIALDGHDSIQPVLEWYHRPYVKGSGPWRLAPGGCRAQVLDYATAHIGPDSLCLFEAALQKNDIELELDCLECWTQFEHPESQALVAERLTRIIADQELDKEHRLEAIRIGTFWNPSLLEPELVHCLHDSKRPIREAAARALGRLGQKYQPLAMEMLCSRKAQDRSTAVYMLELNGTREAWGDLERACHDEKTPAVREEMHLLLQTLSAGFNIVLDCKLAGCQPESRPKPLIPRYKFSKVPELRRTDGNHISEFDLHYLLLCQWRSGQNIIAPETASILNGLDSEHRDALAFYLSGDEPPYFHCPLWIKPLIAALSGPKTLTCSFVYCSQDFAWRHVANALATVRILNTEGSEQARKQLDDYQRAYPWFATLPWPGWDGDNMFESTLDR